MKVIYEFDCSPESDDSYEIKVHQNAHKMFSALSDISDYMRSIRKGYDEDLTVDDVEERISDLVVESGIHEIE